ncbi:MAG: signal recognition particle [Marine Group III euryarchaeote CG-Bathy1]|uniref:Signal recognition particle 54 kDa protein n=1 Tax=Marine Group III euryarchaeote CG-Bathy1 TaxID=1889001 RepID=A0A1J5TBK2_9ARCH|nr:MAG: signal recognition particle [Marine Group III euryarchaeote CG-Bathy1]
MVLEGLGEALRNSLRKIAGASHISPKLIKELVKDIQRALLQADVNVKLALELSKEIERRSLEEKPPAGMTGREHVVRIVHQELVKSLGTPRALNLKSQRIMLVGLYGQGKTTTCGKLAKYFQRKGMSVGLIAADVHRPAAYEQLSQLGENLNVPVYGEKDSKDAPELVKKGMEELAEREILIIDTAGRHSLDDDLITEMKGLSKVVKPDETMLVLDAAVGQQAGPQASAFHEAVGVTGVILTKLDGTAKGGGAISAVAVTDAPIMLVGTGEGPNDLEVLDADRFIGRLLGMGDLQSLLERAEEVIESDKAEDTAKRMMSGKFNLIDLKEQMEAITKMGPLGKVMEMIPGMSSMTKGTNIEETQKKLETYKVMMNSMTNYELENPKEIKKSRIERISKGSGVEPLEIKSLLKYYNQMKKMMGSMSGNRRMQQKLMRQFESGDMKLQ